MKHMMSVTPLEFGASTPLLGGAFVSISVGDL